MIHISTGPADPGEILIKFPEYAQTINRERCVPEIRLSRPTTPSRKAAEMEAWRMVPVPNQDESDEDFAGRAQPVLAALGFDKVVESAGLESGLQAAAQTLDLVKLVQLHILDWKHFGDAQSKKAVEPTPMAVQALIVGHPAVAKKIEREINRALGQVVREGSG